MHDTGADNNAAHPDAGAEHDFLKTTHANSPPENVKQIFRRLWTDSKPQGRIVGASLLCVVVDPVWFRVYFLLGKERRTPHWRAGSNKWSEFGGKVCADAPTAEDTAAKEFVEETLAVVKFFDHDTLPRTQYADIAASLRNGEYIFKIKIIFGTAGDPCHHVTFVKQIPWDPATVARFQTCRDLIVQPAGLSRAAVHENRLLDKNPCVAARPSPTSPPPPPDDPDNAGWTLSRGRRKKTHRAATLARRAAAAAGDDGTQGRCTVHPDFLEKQALGFWSIPQLQRAVELKGVLSRKNATVEKCRDNFVTIVELVLSELAFIKPTLFD
jgi:8-oxo-dGTP pyrophosphatase MutT (NUDIX family)